MEWEGDWLRRKGRGSVLGREIEGSYSEKDMLKRREE